MKLICRPVGRGRWREIVIKVEGDRAAPMLVKPGDRIPLGGITLRVVRVLP